MSNTSTFWDRIAEKYAKKPVRDPDAYARTLERVRSYLADSDSVPELGSGTGTTALLLADSVGHLTASDLSPNMIGIAAEKVKRQGTANVAFLSADLFDPALGEGPYDAVLAFNLLHLLPDTAEAVRHIHGLLKPGGYFISKTFCLPEARLPLLYRAMRLALPVLQWLGKAPYVNFMRTGELQGIIAAAGFDIVETGDYPASPPNRFIVARKASTYPGLFIRVSDLVCGHGSSC